MVDKRGRTHILSEKEKETRKRMIKKMDESQKKLDSATNKKVAKKIMSDSKTQKRMAGDAVNAAGHRVVGDIIITFLKPLYFELHDCLVNGIENGVDASGFKHALTLRMNRMKTHVEMNAKSMCQGGILNFISSFFSMLIEGILQCFVGIFKHITRAVSEGLRIFMRAIPVLRDKNKSAAEKGDAILKIVAFSSTALVGIGIEALLNQMKIGEPFSIIAASILSTVLMALVMYILEKMDLFNLKHDAKKERIEEALSLIRTETDEILEGLIDSGKKFRELRAF